ncbi:hypothetical protein ACHHYP_00534 [Achlya hypogyna]|uniref:Uncharacterized protein n=1 Tax=Achlya hypogyna TaxID=1202772 RepID=A0A1V9ZUD8_ACHHY|nr:hypothetical protein ACHHYP_00534 [Achlya hypogyna]
MSLKKRRYVGNANAKKRQEVEGTFGTTLHCRHAAGHALQTLPSPERPKVLQPVRPSTPPPATAAPCVQDILVENILRHQHETKTFKTETWYSSPAGYGAISNAIIAALSVKDKARTGFVSIDDVVDTFTKMNFGLREDQVRELLADNNTEHVHYKSFAKQFDLPPTKSEDPIERQERHVRLLQARLLEPSRVPVPTAVGKRKLVKTVLDKIETPALPPIDVLAEATETTPTFTIETHVQDVNASSPTFNIETFARGTKVPSPTRYSAKLAPGVIPQTATTLLLGGDMRNTPNSLRRARLLPQVIDQSRKEGRRKAKKEILAGHLDRIDAYAAAKDYETKMYEENHVKATTAKHLAYSQAFLEQTLQISNKEHRKGLLFSSTAQKNHNVSTQSMFHHDSPR